MNKLILSLLGIFSLFSLHAQVCGTETFTSANLTATYADGSYVGDNGVTWTYVHSRDESTYGITGKGIMLRRQSSSSKLTSSSVSGGIADFTCSLRKAFTGAGNRQVELFVNNISVGTSIAWDNTNVQTFTVTGINVSGPVVIEIRNITGNQVIVDDISWTCYSGAPTPTITVSPLSFSGLDYVFGAGPSASQSGGIQGANLSGFVSGTAINNFEFSLDDITYLPFGGGVFPFVGTVTPTTVYMRLIAGLAVGVYNETLTLSSPGASSVDVTLSGEVLPPVVPCSQLFISEYGEPNGGSNKYIEIYNPTASAVDLSNYQIWVVTNGGTWPEGTLTLSGTLASGDVFVVGNNGFDSNIDLINTTVTGFNGNDAVGLAYNGGSGSVFTLIDAVGTDGADPGTGWDVAGTTNATANNILTRKSTVQNPNPNWTSSAGTSVANSEWELTAYTGGMTLSTIGSHSSDCIVVSCAITAIAAGTQTACVPATNEYTQQVVVSYTSAPATGTLDVNGQSFAITSSPQTVTLTGLVSDGNAVDVVASFSDLGVCSATELALFTAPSSCLPVLANCSQLLISEYGEPNGGNNKYIEIYNPSASAVDLSNYQIWLVTNGGTWPEASLTLSGTLAPYDVYVVANSALANLNVDLSNNTVTGFNGNDAVGLAYNGGSGSSFSLIDAVGTDGADPGTGWNVAGVSNATKDNILVRKASVQVPNTDWSNSAGTSAANSEWEVSSYTGGMVLSNLGFHLSDCASTLATNIWTGTTSVDWQTASNWSENMVPLIGQSVLIPTAPAGGVFPLTSATITCYDLNIQNGASLTIGAAYGLILAPSGTLLNNGSLILQANASGSAWLDEFTGNASLTGTGTYTAQQYVTTGSSVGQRFFGSPVNNGVVVGLSQTYASGSTGQIIMTNCASAQVTAASPYNNLFEWHEDAISPNNCEYEAWFARLQAIPLENGRGYSGWMQDGSLISFTGSFNSGNVSYGGALTNSGLGLANKDGWHVLSNPYPSSININPLTLSGWESPQTYDGASAAYGGTFQPILPGQDLAIAQGFVMKTTGASSADYTNAMRSQGSTQFKSNDAWYDAKLNIEVSNGSYGDISYIYFNQNASSAFDAQWDCEKRYSDAGRPTIYSKTGSVKTSLNGNNMADLGAYSFPLGLNPGGNHTCTFTVTGLETLPASSLVYLEDKVTGTWTNLREVNTYSFSMTTQENEERFELHFTKPILISYEAESCEGNDGSIYVDFGNQSIAGSLVSWNYDISKDMQSLASDSESDFLALESLQPGTYEISLANGNYQFMESIVIEDKIQVEVNVELPTLDVYTNEQFLINNLSQGADTYTWEINNESFNTIDLSYSFSQAGIYPFSILASNVDCNALYNGTITVLDKTTGIKESVALADVMVYTKDNTIVVDLSKANLKSSTQLEVYSIVGQILTQKFNVEEVEFIEMANQAKGYYFVRIINNQDQVTKKVLIK